MCSLLLERYNAYAGHLTTSVTRYILDRTGILTSLLRMPLAGRLVMRGLVSTSSAPRVLSNFHAPLMDAFPKVATSLLGSESVSRVSHDYSTEVVLTDQDRH